MFSVHLMMGWVGGFALSGFPTALTRVKLRMPSAHFADFLLILAHFPDITGKISRGNSLTNFSETSPPRQDFQWLSKFNHLGNPDLRWKSRSELTFCWKKSPPSSDRISILHLPTEIRFFPRTGLPTSRKSGSHTDFKSLLAKSSSSKLKL
jgi:hypothetical protein